MPQRNLLVILILTAFSYACYIRNEQNPYARYAASSYQLIDQWALEDVPNEELFAGAVEGMVSVLERRGDEHSRYISRTNADAFQAEMRQQFGGIGVRIRPLGDPPRLTVVGPPEPDSPAARAGILAGDTIVAIDGVATAGMDMLEILRRMRGEVGDPLRLEVIHPGREESVTLEMIRETITIDSILGDRRLADGRWRFRLDEHPWLAYIRIVHFGDMTVVELTSVLEKLASGDGVDALILDLRDNAGGALDAAVAVSDMFLREGLLIVETRGRDRDLEERYVSSGRGKYLDIPIAILINQNSASASEILAACLQDHERAVVIGSRSFGKGTVQRVLEIGSRGNSFLKITSASYWRPSGENIHRMADDDDDDSWGVVPDPGFEVELSDEQYLAYREYRNQRDLIDDSEQRAESSERNGNSEDFVDQAMEMAIGYLSTSLPD